MEQLIQPARHVQAPGENAQTAIVVAGSISAEQSIPFDRL